jgi:D-threo-aldose 1-dehydrogenase
MKGTAMNWRELRELGHTGLKVTGICVGGSPIGSMPMVYGYAVEEDRGVATVRATLAGPFNFLDTSNGYGDGASERRIGAAIKANGGLPPGFVLDTKVDADRKTKDFSGDRVRRSVEESFERLGITSCQLMYFHDPEYHMTFEEAMRPGGPVEALVQLKDEGIVANIGIAAGPIPMLIDFVRTDLFQVVLSHNRFTLLDRSADPLIDESIKRRVAYVNAAPYGGGILARGPKSHPNYMYRPAKAETLAAAYAMEAACAKHSVPLGAAALQFSLRDPRIGSTVVGMSDPARIAETVALADHPIPDSLWGELETLLPPRSVWVG